MLNITLPDGNKLNFKQKVTGIQIAEKISKSLLKEALVMSVDGNLKDLTYEIEKDSLVKIFTSKDNEGLETIRHDTAHILAMAVQELFPGTQVTIGPTIENGFYYDFSRKEPFTESDLTLNGMGAEGRKNVIKKFNVEKMCFSTYSEYKKLLN